jgi:FixJ family two-component response regulator
MHAPLPCILISAEADERLLEQARAAHAFDVLKKPVTRDGVITVVFNALRTAYDAATWKMVLGS